MYSFGFIRGGIRLWGFDSDFRGVFSCGSCFFLRGEGGSSVLPRFKALKLVPIVITG